MVNIELTLYKECDNMGEKLSRLWSFSTDNAQKDDPFAKGGAIEEIPLKLIVPNPFQPRKSFAAEQLEELAESIKNYGLLQPILVRKSGENYQLISGERRLRASKMIGLESIPAMVRELTDQEAAEMALVENLSRADLNYFEEAEGYLRLIKEFALTQDEIAKRMGKSQPTIANKLRLLTLPPNVRLAIEPTQITERHARSLLKLKDEDKQLAVLEKIYKEGLNVRQTDNYIAQLLALDEELKQKNRRLRMGKAFRDMKIFLNTINSAVDEIRAVGLNAEIKEQDYDEYVEVIITLPKKIS